MFWSYFFLIPLFDLTTSFVILGFISVLTIILSKQNKITIIISLLFLAIFIFFLLPSEEVSSDSLYFETQTPYQELKVYDFNGVRLLLLDGYPQSSMILDDPLEHNYEYTEYFHIPLLVKNVSSVLFIGGGGFTGPREFAYLNKSIDVVELDPDVVDVAKKYFFVDDSMMNITVQDGRVFLKNTDKKFDLIIIDAYKRDKVPFHMATEEFYSLVHDSLTPDGAIVLNIISAHKGAHTDFLSTMHKTIDSVFPSVYSFHTSDDPYRLQNIEIMAFKNETLLSSESLLTLAQKNTTRINLEKQSQNIVTNIDVDSVQILTDEKSTCRYVSLFIS